jgi:hypothetical protein
MDVKALQLLSRFALPPNLTGACGTNETPHILRNCIISGECDILPNVITTFKTMWPQLQLIGKVSGNDPLLYQAVQAYWLGNDLLKKQWPEGKIPFHLTRVLEVAHNLPIDPNISAINDCAVRWGKILEVGENVIKARLQSLTREKEHYKLTQQEEEVQYDLQVLKTPKAGEILACHRGHACKKLTREEEKNLSFWTLEILKSQMS